MVVSSSEKDSRASLVEIVSEEVTSVLTPEEVLELELMLILTWTTLLLKIKIYDLMMVNFLRIIGPFGPSVLFLTLARLSDSPFL